MDKKYRRLKYACYTVNLSMAAVANLSPVLFITFRAMYGISYSLLGLLVLINFVTQLSVDLIFSFFSHRFHIPLTVKLTPVLTVAGLLVYAIWPSLLPQSAYAGLVVGTLLFAASGGLSEVLISPVIAAIPSDEPEREMSKLHAVYAWGVVLLIGIVTAFLLLFGAGNWQWLVLGLTAFPLLSLALFAGSEIPPMETPERTSGALRFLKEKSLWLCTATIFLGSAAENNMAQWASGYLERALGIEKVWGDVFGVAMFALTLGLGRTLYSKIGKNVGRVLFFGTVGASLCYLTAALSPVPVMGLAACALCGFCVSMLWPGSLIVAANRFPAGGVFIYAMMAAGGDLGASVGPQLIGLITDAVMNNPASAALAQSLRLTAEQAGMKVGMLTGMLFPLAAIPVYLHIWRGKSES